MGGRGRIATLTALAAALALPGPAVAQLVTPTVTGPASPGNHTTVAWTFEPPAAECRLDGPGGEVAGWGPCISPAQYTFGQDGEYKFTARVGTEEASSTYLLDTVPPAGPSIVTGPPQRSGNSMATFAFSAGPGATECRLDRGGGIVNDWTACTSPKSYDLSTEPDGDYEFLVRTRDMAGNLSQSATRGFTLLRAGVCINLFTGTSASETLIGSLLGDVVLGDAGNDIVDGRNGDDCVLGNAGNDQLDGSSGDDDVRGMRGNDRLSGGPGDDHLAGGAGNDSANGDSGNDTVAGGTGWDSVAGRAGSDTLSGGKGRDGISGGAGNDAIDSRDGVRERVACGPGLDSVKADRDDRLTGCERRSLK